ncbi:hypothetical protein B0H67DRAFT_98423 [Lasiosphaeris hirsuta]|uniref:Protein kinase domain-containing protein n=1 Tax=Lasiosphaeris hirsuta TaxID=260670 RepID=A0AA40DH99_9PEZI|nr:hypothetical protein B0H67DRAFT_98423 [Lasiosphaeris hirsuta]
MSLSFWCTSTAPGSQTPEPESPTPFTALNFLAALSVPDLKLYSLFGLGLSGSSVRHAGSGGYAVVEIGTENYTGRAVAVKRSRLLSGAVPGRNGEVFRRHFGQLVLELRILGHRKLRKHAGIVDLLGICIDQVNGAPDLALVLEYSQLGSLKSFLADRRDDHGPSLVAQIDLIRQVASALEALHQLRVCHGDVKMENVLMFSREDGSWLAKISDFGQSIIAPATMDDDPARVGVPVGTPLLAAPEIRTGSALRDDRFNIDSAMLTDVFSFGLLAWEVLKFGTRFFDLVWSDPDSSSAADSLDVDSIVDFLNRLPPNKLCLYALRELQRLAINDLEQLDNLDALLDGALQDDPSARKTMAELAGIVTEKPSEADVATHTAQDQPVLTRDLFPKTNSVNDDDDDDSQAPSFETLSDVSSLGSLYDLFDGALAAWTSRSSLYEVREQSVWLSDAIFDELPENLRRLVLADLDGLATAGDVSAPVRAHAAMTMSECYTLGFGVNHDTTQVTYWLLKAAMSGLRKATLWYHRVCVAVGEVPSSEAEHLEGRELEEALPSVPTELYLLHRIQRHNMNAVEQARKSLDVPTMPASSSFVFRLSIFSEDVVDELPLLHLFSWLGDLVAVQDLLTRSAAAPDAKSKLGFSAAHYACLGGSLPTLRILVDHAVPLLPAAFGDITPLHFCVFMPIEDLPEAVALLLSGGTPVDAGQPREFNWDDHDIRLGGSPLFWAIKTRNRPMVQLLLPHYDKLDHVWVFIAISRFFWDILEDLLLRFKDELDINNVYTRLHPLDRPFSHWIAHGSGHIEAIQRTVQLCIDHDLMRYDTEDDGDSGHLKTLITNARTQGDTDLIEAVVAGAPRDYIKHEPAGLIGEPVMMTIFSMTGNSPIWYGTLRRMADLYTVEELERSRVPQGNMLTAAVIRGSLVGARVLLEKGIDVNKPYQVVEGVEMTAIHDCINVSGSAEMMALLVEFGADLVVKDSTTSRAPLQWLMMGRLQTDAVLELLLKHDYQDSFYAAVLDHSLTWFIAAELDQPVGPSTQGLGDVLDRRTHREQLRTLLTHPRIARHVNTLCEQGYSLIHKAAIALHLETVRLLLDAGADASVPLRVGQLQLLPLQLACAQARVLSLTDALGGMEYQQDAISPRRRAQALLVAEELLRWHQARGDGLFGGIEARHIACRTLILQSGLELPGPGPRTGDDAVGNWPGVKEGLRPQDLIRRKLGEDDEISAMVEAVNFDKFDGFRRVFR